MRLSACVYVYLYIYVHIYEKEKKKKNKKKNESGIPDADVCDERSPKGIKHFHVASCFLLLFLALPWPSSTLPRPDSFLNSISRMSIFPLLRTQRQIPLFLNCNV